MAPIHCLHFDGTGLGILGLAGSHIYFGSHQPDFPARVFVRRAINDSRLLRRCVVEFFRHRSNKDGYCWETCTEPRVLNTYTLFSATLASFVVIHLDSAPDHTSWHNPIATFESKIGYCFHLSLVMCPIASFDDLIVDIGGTLSVEGRR